MQKAIIVKIGGSIFTEKASGKPILRPRILIQIAKELRLFLRTHNTPIILIHGAGSFGHPLVQRYSLHNAKTKKKDKMGSVITHHAVQKLQTEVASIFLKARLPVFSLSSSSLSVQSKGRIRYFNTAPIITLLQHKYIPMLTGDVTTDLESEISVLSGDQIARFLSNNLHAQRVIFLSDVKGIYSEDPKQNLKAIFLPSILKKKAKILSLNKKTSKQKTPDVTGLMQGKLSEITGISAPVIVCSGLSQGNLLKALEGKNPGTLIS